MLRSYVLSLQTPNSPQIDALANWQSRVKQIQNIIIMHAPESSCAVKKASIYLAPLTSAVSTRIVNNAEKMIQIEPKLK